MVTRLACLALVLSATCPGSSALPRRPTPLFAHRSASKMVRGGADAAAGAPLPEGWTAHTDEQTGQVYYVNHADGTTSWEPPAMAGAGEPAGGDPAAASAAVAAAAAAAMMPNPEWQEVMDLNTGRPYYVHLATGETTYDPPPLVPAPGTAAESQQQAHGQQPHEQRPHEQRPHEQQPHEQQPREQQVGEAGGEGEVGLAEVGLAEAGQHEQYEQHEHHEQHEQREQREQHEQAVEDPATAAVQVDPAAEALSYDPYVLQSELLQAREERQRAVERLRLAGEAAEAEMGRRAAAEAEAEEARAAVEAEKERIQRLDGKLREAQKSADEKEKELRQLGSEVKSKKFDYLVSERDNFKAQLSFARGNLTVLTKEAKGANRTLAAAEKRAERLGRQVESLRRKVNAKGWFSWLWPSKNKIVVPSFEEVEMRKLNTTNLELKANQSALHVTIGSLEGSLEQAVAANAKVSTALRDEAAKVKELEGNVERLAGEAADAIRGIKAHEAAAMECRAEAVGLREQLEAMQAAAETESKDTAEMTRALAEAKAAVAATEERCAEAAAATEVERAAASEVATELVEAKAELAEAKAAVAEAEERCAALQAGEASSAELIGKHQAEDLRLRFELDKLTEEATALRTQVAEGDAALKALLVEKESLTENLSEQLERATRKQEAVAAATEEAVAEAEARARAEAVAEAAETEAAETDHLEGGAPGRAVPGIVWEGWLEKMGRKGDNSMGEFLSRMSAGLATPGASRYQWRYVLVSSSNILQVWTPPVDARSKGSSFPGRFLRVVTGKLAAKARSWGELAHKLNETGFECKASVYANEMTGCEFGDNDDDGTDELLLTTPTRNWRFRARAPGALARLKDILDGIIDEQHELQHGRAHKANTATEPDESESESESEDEPANLGGV